MGRRLVFNGNVEKRKDRSGLISFSFWKFLILNLLWSVSLCSRQDTHTVRVGETFLGKLGTQ